jgi:hypothetical protein
MLNPTLLVAAKHAKKPPDLKTPGGFFVFGLLPY